MFCKKTYLKNKKLILKLVEMVLIVMNLIRKSLYATIRLHFYQKSAYYLPRFYKAITNNSEEVINSYIAFKEKPHELPGETPSRLPPACCNYFSTCLVRNRTLSALKNFTWKSLNFTWNYRLSNIDCLYVICEKRQ